jgi:hypothetical protein
MDNTLVAGGETSGASQVQPAWMMTCRGSGLVIERPRGRGIFAPEGAGFGENISKARRRCIIFFIEWRSFFNLCPWCEIEVNSR